jgi:hypothetical protein
VGGRTQTEEGCDRIGGLHEWGVLSARAPAMHYAVPNSFRRRLQVHSGLEPPAACCAYVPTEGVGRGGFALGRGDRARGPGMGQRSSITSQCRACSRHDKGTNLLLI